MKLHRKTIKKIISFIMIISVLTGSIAIPIQAAGESNTNSQMEYYSYQDEEGTIMNLKIETTNSEVISKVYKEEVLIGKAKRQLDSKIVYDEIYDLEIGSPASESETKESNGFTVITTHLGRSNECLNAE